MAEVILNLFQDPIGQVYAKLYMWDAEINSA
jgi:hypothetical protein